MTQLHESTPKAPDAAHAACNSHNWLCSHRAALDEAYGDRIERVVLFGSRAR
jgi:hypothetical protein